MSAETYLDNTGRDDVLGGGARRIPITTPKGTFHVWTKRFGNNPTTKLLLLHGGPACHPRVLRGVRLLPARRRHRVLLLRPARLGVQRSARRSRPVAARPVRRRGRAGARRPRTGRRQLLPAGPLVGWHPRHRVRAEVPAQSEGAGHLQHDDEHPRVQRVRTQRADARDGSGGARGDQAARGSRRDRDTEIHGTARRATTASTCSACPPTSGRTR